MNDRNTGYLNSGPRRNRGAALLLGLILLSALTLLGVASGSNSVLQGQMAQNLENHIHSRQAAAFAIRWGEAWLLSRPGTQRPPGCETGCDSDDVVRSTGSIPYPLEQSTRSWWDSAAHEAGTDPQTGVSLSPGVGPDVTPPRWFIEEIHHQAVTVDDSVLDIGFYRIVAHGSGPYDRHITISEAIVARPWGIGVTAVPFPPDATLSQFCAAFSAEIPCGRLAWRLHR